MFNTPNQNDNVTAVQLITAIKQDTNVGITLTCRLGLFAGVRHSTTK